MTVPLDTRNGRYNSRPYQVRELHLYWRRSITIVTVKDVLQTHVMIVVVLFPKLEKKKDKGKKKEEEEKDKNAMIRPNNTASCTFPKMSILVCKVSHDFD